MTILNRRNAFLGWVVWETGKRMARKKAKNVLPGMSEEVRPARKRKRRALAAALAATVGAVMFWRKRAAAPDTFGE
jgi:hypothetical protein